MPEQYSITESDNGRTFTYVITTTFGITLDEGKHPLRNLSLADCPIIGYMSNWSANGPDNYPIGFQVTRKGSCLLRNGSFHVRIVGVGGP